jgi:hypothetical protein
MKSTTADVLKRSQSNKRMAPTDSIFLLEKNLNTLKRQFLDLEVKLKHPRPATFQPKSPEPRSTIYELNAKLIRDKENIEKKAIHSICENAKLEEKVSDFKIKNSILSRELELEHSVNKRVVAENLDMKQNLDLVERTNNLLATKLDLLKEGVQEIVKEEAQKECQLVEAKVELHLLTDRNKTLQEKNQILAQETIYAKTAVEQLARDKCSLQGKVVHSEVKILEKEEVIAALSRDNETLQRQLAASRINNEALERQVVFLETEKKDIMNSLTKSYRTETELLGEIAILRTKVALLEEKNDVFQSRIWRLMS